MNAHLPLRRSARALLLLLALPLAGCSLGQPSPDQAFFILEAPAGPATEATGTAPVLLRVPRARVAPPFGSRGFQERIAVHRYHPRYYDRWADDPGSLIAAAVGDALDAHPAISVVDEASSADDALRLELSITTLCIDHTGPDGPRSELSMRATLLDDGGMAIMTRRFDRSVPPASDAAADLVRAWNEALASITGELGEAIEAGVAGAG